MLVIRIDEDPEPPYITNKGLIYERVSSSSCVIKDSGRLQHLYIKRLDRLKDMEEKVSIISLGNAYANLYAYLDMGFVMVNRNEELLFDRFWNVKI